jgi:hypothetical protein
MRAACVITAAAAVAVDFPFIPSRRRTSCPVHVASQSATCRPHATFSAHDTGALRIDAKYPTAVRGTCIQLGIRLFGAYQLSRW